MINCISSITIIFVIPSLIFQVKYLMHFKHVYFDFILYIEKFDEFTMEIMSMVISRYLSSILFGGIGQYQGTCPLKTPTSENVESINCIFVLVAKIIKCDSDDLHIGQYLFCQRDCLIKAN